MSVETFGNDGTGIHKYWISFRAPGMAQHDCHIELFTGRILTRAIMY